ncbi:hypothetical protein VNO78_35183 [Psophocarpus tetragonolobus]|uniref:Uncharacterized protein n=1 Tax=Psophocarpus tetragonolobus TaxID=3891 RepID=A0AAN9NM76_PSOTE
MYEILKGPRSGTSRAPIKLRFAHDSGILFFVFWGRKSLASAPHPRFTSLGQFMLRRTPASCFRQSVVPYFENDTVRRNSNSFG